jgi:nitrate/nitrite transporter NarK
MIATTTTASTPRRQSDACGAWRTTTMAYEGFALDTLVRPLFAYCLVWSLASRSAFISTVCVSIAYFLSLSLSPSLLQALPVDRFQNNQKDKITRERVYFFSFSFLFLFFALCAPIYDVSDFCLCTNFHLRRHFVSLSLWSRTSLS